MTTKSIHDLERLLAKIEGMEGQHERSEAVRAQIERMRAEEAN